VHRVSERDEAEFVTHRIRERVAQAGAARSPSSTAQRPVARVEAFLSARPQPRLRRPALFERAEIKDALAYLRLIANRADDASFERVVNLPTRGVGAKSLDILREHARANSCSLWEAAAAAITAGTLGAKAAQAIHGFMGLIERTARAGRSGAKEQRADRALPAREGRAGRGARGEPRRTGVRRARLHPRGE
jgi:DNA helicase-2/ATP-dependent DNA helicase PcrA